MKMTVASPESVPIFLTFLSDSRNDVSQEAQWDV